MLKNLNLINLLVYNKFLIKLLPNVIISSSIKKNNIYLVLNKKDIFFLVSFLKFSFFCKFNNFISISCTDYIDNKNRFELFYNLLSNKYNFRIFLKLYCNELDSVISISNIFKGSGWYEREVWDMFGVFFSFNKNLRRILTDYGFIGYPFRKDFPQTGFFEIRYDDEKKYIVSESLELAQEFRNFQFHKPWLSIK